MATCRLGPSARGERDIAGGNSVNRDWQDMSTAPLAAPLDDYGPYVELLVDGEVKVGRYCGGLELSDIWIPPGWYVDGEEVDPAAWRLKEGPA